MKQVTAKMFFALAAVALAAPFFAVAVLVGARAVELAGGARENVLMLSLALAAAASQVLGARGERLLRSAREKFGVGRSRPARKASALPYGW